MSYGVFVALRTPSRDAPPRRALQTVFVGAAPGAGRSKLCDPLSMSGKMSHLETSFATGSCIHRFACATAMAT